METAQREERTKEGLGAIVGGIGCMVGGAVLLVVGLLFDRLICWAPVLMVVGLFTFIQGIVKMFSKS